MWAVGKYDSWLYEGFGMQEVGLTNMAFPNRKCGGFFVHLFFLNVATLSNKEVWEC